MLDALFGFCSSPPIPRSEEKRERISTDSGLDDTIRDKALKILNKDTSFESARYCYQDDSTLAKLVELDLFEPVDRTFSEGHTALMLSASSGYSQTLKAFLKKGASLDYKCYSRTAFDYAYGSEKYTAAAVLLIAGEQDAYIRDFETISIDEFMCFTPCKDLPKRLKNGWTFLHLAAAFGREDLVEVLLSNGLDPNAKDSEGHTPLHLAVKENRPQVVEVLLKNGANVHLPDNREKTPLYVACGNSDLQMVKLLVRFGGVSANTLLHAAVDNRRYGRDIIIFLIERGVDIETKRWGKTALAQAILNYSFENAELLIQKGANINARDDEGNTILQLCLAGCGARERRIDFLLAHGADPKLLSISLPYVLESLAHPLETLAIQIKLQKQKIKCD